ncbi:type II secretion system protein [Metapseudomonas furukawaii]|jgi:type II secretory pathway pseudopilin PulG|uniref:Predicted secretion system X pseudopilin PulG-like n=1 Tax=Metapseudomonas furukawaii TaxID=1149133 RepID=A0AAD1C389_METFU|nr:type II secretion system protein [Pseudomonas furukawaii]ELS26389.1 putative secretion system X pseudopilin PulG-like protein [Pseudomonas furukawaii]WAG78387.1 type II secretion system GspH family protein [Pseudomonas furukawaii]BAU76669.1 predicted secretion system X pseudopilin PulG-like [Pseudomonas furukawaii]
MRTGERGFTYLGVLFLVMLMGMALAGAGQLWSTTSQRARERDLLWVGNQYAQALRSYYRASPGVAQYPASLEDLLEDNRFPSPRQHLRRLYPDPITGRTDWGLVRAFDGRIAGVYSPSRQAPLKQARFPAEWVEFEGLRSYADWRFVAEKAFMEGTPGRTTP